MHKLAMSRLIHPPKKYLSLSTFVVAAALSGCGSPADAAPVASPAGSASTTAGNSVVTSSPVVLASASDLEHLNAIALADGYVYFTGGGTVAVPSDAAPGSDTFGVLRRVPVGGGAAEDLWRGQGIGYAVAPISGGIAFVTYDYQSRGRTGVVRVLRADRTVEQLGTWRSQGSCVGLAARDGALFWTHSEGASGVVNRTDGSGTTRTVMAEGVCTGKPHLAGERLYWLAGSRVFQATTSSLAGGSLWDAGRELQAIATHDGAAEIVVAGDDQLVAIDPSSGRTRAIGTGYHGTTDLAFDAAGLRVYAANTVDGTISATSLADGAKTVVATSQSQPRGIVAGADAVYWIDGTRSVMTARRY
jgi:hypothetical protein